FFARILNVSCRVTARVAPGWRKSLRDDCDQDGGPSPSDTKTIPTGLREYAENFPFLGALRGSHDTVVAGAWEEIVLDYIVGASGIADGARLKIDFKFYTDWALFQTSDPQAANFVSAEYAAGPLVPGQSPATVQALKISFRPENQFFAKNSERAV
ncbi:MAG: hypothetical protein WAK60_03040, partial [Sedimentisphaerales bacterium]